jgi:DNA-binding protein YbaB
VQTKNEMKKEKVMVSRGMQKKEGKSWKDSINKRKKEKKEKGEFVLVTVMCAGRCILSSIPPKIYTYIENVLEGLVATIYKQGQSSTKTTPCLLFILFLNLTIDFINQL